MTETEGQLEWWRDLRTAIEEDDKERALAAVDAAIKLVERGIDA